MIVCKECKHLVWYKWWWPYIMGIYEIEVRQDCDHPKNHRVFHDAVTGEDHPLVFTIRSCQNINEHGDCAWFEAGHHPLNLYGEMIEEDKEKLARYRESGSKSKRRWFW